MKPIRVRISDAVQRVFFIQNCYLLSFCNKDNIIDMHVLSECKDHVDIHVLDQGVRVWTRQYWVIIGDMGSDE